MPLPKDLLDFVRESRQLVFDPATTDVGAIRLKSATELEQTTITTFTSQLHDPFASVDGTYQIEVWDLVAESEEYDPEGLLCWIARLEMFGCVDPEHGDVITFSDSSWSDIVKKPGLYLDAQWAVEGVGARIHSWLHFPFKTSPAGLTIPPPPAECTLHLYPLNVAAEWRTDSFRSICDKDPAKWLDQKISKFPWGGYSVSESTCLCCETCAKEEKAWFEAEIAAMPAIPATQNADGWVKCPGCGIKFSTRYSESFKEGMHLRCGQKITVI